ncbi:hypothetical protein FACS1894208_05070 [Clostridia bacterium]|nr:hypothetical protein FACS1894208_05070 [Clostridia bacterium]
MIRLGSYPLKITNADCTTNCVSVSIRDHGEFIYLATNLPYQESAEAFEEWYLSTFDISEEVALSIDGIIPYNYYDWTKVLELVQNLIIDRRNIKELLATFFSAESVALPKNMTSPVDCTNNIIQDFVSALTNVLAENQRLTEELKSIKAIIKSLVEEVTKP